MQYAARMRDECGASESVTIDADTLDEAKEQADEELDEWVRGGDWGAGGKVIEAWWVLSDEDGNQRAEGHLAVEIEPDHERLIALAGGDTSCDHDWTSDGEGGCDENPGVWSTGGTALVIAKHCRLCGLHRTECLTGSQRNPGEHDTVTYRQPDSWCPTARPRNS